MTVESPTPDTKRVRIHPGRAALGVLLMLISLAILAWQVRNAGPGEIWLRLQQASPAWLAIALGATLLRFVAFAARLAGTTRRAVRAHTRQLIPAVMISQLLGLLVPGVRAAAVFVRAHIARRRVGGSMPDHLSANLIDQLALMTSWMIAVIALLPALAWYAPGPSTRRLSLLAIGVVAVVVLAAVVIARTAPRLQRWLALPRGGRWGRIASASSQTLQGTSSLVLDWRAGLAGIAGGLAFVTLTAAAQLASCAAVGAPIPFWLAILAVTVGTAAGTVIHTPGGVGVTELAQVSFLTQYGLDFQAATSAVLIMRGLHYAAVAAWGTPLLVWEGWFPRAAFGTE